MPYSIPYDEINRFKCICATILNLCYEHMNQHELQLGTPQIIISWNDQLFDHICSQAADICSPAADICSQVGVICPRAADICPRVADNRGHLSASGGHCLPTDPLISYSGGQKIWRTCPRNFWRTTVRHRRIFVRGGQLSASCPPTFLKIFADKTSSPRNFRGLFGGLSAS